MTKNQSIFLVIQCLIAWCFFAGGATQLGGRQIDLQLQLLAKLSQTEQASNEVVIVGIDDQSLASFNVPIATLHVQLGRFFEAMALAKPSAIGVDMVLPEVSYDSLNPGLDAALARGIAVLRSVAPMVVGRGAYADGTARRIHPPFETLLGADRLGWAFASRDADGVVRRFDEAIGEGGQIIPTLSGQLARQLQWPVPAGILPFHQGPRMGFIPLRDVLVWHDHGDIAELRSAFAGRLVLLGSVLSHDDQHLVPIPLAIADTANTTHGVYVLAHHLRALANDTLVRELSPILQFGIAFILIFSWWMRPGRAAWLIVCMGTVGIGVLSQVFFSQGWSIPAAFWAFALLAGQAARSLLRMAEVVVERRLLRQSFQGSVSPSVLNAILAGRLNPHRTGEKMGVCVLFSDLRGFTSISENLPPEEATDLLNRYFERMTQVIHKHNGTLDKFIGDGIMALFGAPQTLPNACDSAFKAAVEMFAALEAFNLEQQRIGEPTLRMGIGLHDGPAFVGFIGSRVRNSYSAIGDTVNVASRLEQLTKTLGCSIVMSDQVKQNLSSVYVTESLGVHDILGRKPMSIHGWPKQQG